MTLGPIPASSIRGYAFDYGYDDEELELLRFVMRAMDNVFLNHFNKSSDRPDRSFEKNTVSKENLSLALFRQMFGDGKTRH